MPGKIGVWLRAFKKVNNILLLSIRNNFKESIKKSTKQRQNKDKTQTFCEGFSSAVECSRPREHEQPRALVQKSRSQNDTNDKDNFFSPSQKTGEKKLSYTDKLTSKSSNLLIDTSSEPESKGRDIYGASLACLVTR